MPFFLQWEGGKPVKKSHSSCGALLAASCPRPLQFRASQNTLLYQYCEQCVGDISTAVQSAPCKLNPLFLESDGGLLALRYGME